MFGRFLFVPEGFWVGPCIVLDGSLHTSGWVHAGSLTFKEVYKRLIIYGLRDQRGSLLSQGKCLGGPYLLQKGPGWVHAWSWMGPGRVLDGSMQGT